MGPASFVGLAFIVAALVSMATWRMPDRRNVAKKFDHRPGWMGIPVGRPVGSPEYFADIVPRRQAMCLIFGVLLIIGDLVLGL